MNSIYDILTPRAVASTGLEAQATLDIGSLEKVDLIPVIGWTYSVDQRGYGMAHRIAIKNSPVKDESDYILYFCLPIVRRGNPVTQEIIVSMYTKFGNFIQPFTDELSKRMQRRFVPLAPPVPQHMVDELRILLNSNQPTINLPIISPQ